MMSNTSGKTRKMVCSCGVICYSRTMWAMHRARRHGEFINQNDTHNKYRKIGTGIFDIKRNTEIYEKVNGAKRRI